MLPIRVGFWAQNALNEGPILGRYSLNMGGSSRTWQEIFKMGSFQQNASYKWA